MLLLVAPLCGLYHRAHEVISKFSFVSRRWKEVLRCREFCSFGRIAQSCCLLWQNTIILKRTSGKIILYNLVMQESGSVSKRMKMWKFADGNLYFSLQTGRRPKCVYTLISELGPLNLPACEFLHVVHISYFPF